MQLLPTPLQVRAGCLEAVLGLAIYAKQHADVWDAAAALLREHSGELSSHRMQVGGLCTLCCACCGWHDVAPGLHMLGAAGCTTKEACGTMQVFPGDSPFVHVCNPSINFLPACSPGWRTCCW